MLVIVLFALTRYRYAGFGPPFTPPPKIVGTVGKYRISVVRTSPCSFIAAWSDLDAHYFVHRGGTIEECLWSDGWQMPVRDKADIFMGVIAWFSDIEPNTTISIGPAPCTDVSAFYMAMSDIEKTKQRERDGHQD